MLSSNLPLAPLSRSLFFFTATIATAILSGCAPDAGRPVPGEATLNEAFVADFDLIDMNGTPATDERFEGKPVLIYFGFTYCPDVCPAALSVLSSTLDELGDDAHRLHTLFISIDPGRDSPEQLREHLAFNENILGLTGSQEAIDHALSGMRMFAKKVDLEGSAAGYTVDHYSKFFLIDSTGQPVRAFDDFLDPAVLAERIRLWL